jgi:hypothetical protein
MSRFGIRAAPARDRVIGAMTMRLENVMPSRVLTGEKSLVSVMFCPLSGHKWDARARRLRNT